jgi:hypothetical protein
MFTLLWTAFIVVAGIATIHTAPAQPPIAGLHGNALAGVAGLEIAGAILFLFRRTEKAGAAILLLVFACAEVLSVLSGEVTLRFFFYSGTVLFIGAARRRLPYA